MKTKRYDKRLKLNKKTITELSEKDMNRAFGGQETIAGPRCVSVYTCYPVNTYQTPCKETGGTLVCV